MQSSTDLVTTIVEKRPVLNVLVKETITQTHVLKKEKCMKDFLFNLLILKVNSWEICTMPNTYPPPPPPSTHRVKIIVEKFIILK